jgi:hypothetical protein
VKNFFFRAYMVLLFPVLVIEVPCRELWRAWRNLHVIGSYKTHLKLYVREWKKGY